jgi:hypothetical protein
MAVLAERLLITQVIPAEVGAVLVLEEVHTAALAAAVVGIREAALLAEAITGVAAEAVDPIRLQLVKQILQVFKQEMELFE